MYSKTNGNPERRQRIEDYYRRFNKKKTEKQVVPITISWKVNAYVEEERKGVLKRFLKRCRKSKEDSMENGETKVKHILKNVQGIVKPGQLCAIMGASGAGKTTLLNILNYRNRGKMIIDGDIRINGQSAGWTEVTECSAYVQQDDVFINTLTVKEHLTFLAMMKLSRNMTKDEKLERVEQIMLQMNLLHIQDTYIGEGDRLRGISGGEKRRLAFASEVLTDPQLLFCDEPTSGLDSYMAESIIDVMKLLMGQGKTVLCTIHQPSSPIFEKFDILCLLGEGRVVYFGPTKDAAQFFQSIGKPCPRLYNPADHYIQCVAVMPNTREESLRNVNMICDTFEKSQYQRNVIIISSIVMGLFIGLIYLQLDNNQEGVQNKSGCLFMLLILASFSYIFPVINSFPKELKVFYREIKNRSYSVFPYILSKQLADLPKFLILPFIMVTIAYWMADILNNGRVYIIIALIFVLTTQIATGYAFLLSILSPNSESANGLSGPIVMPLVIFAGFFLNNDSVPNYLIWLKYLSWFFYANEAINIELWTNIDTIDCNAPAGSCPNACRYKTGDDVLALIAVNKANYSQDIGLLFVLLVVPRIMAYVILKIKSRKL